MFIYFLILGFFITFSTPQSVKAITPIASTSAESTVSANKTNLKEEVMQKVKDRIEKISSKTSTSDIGTTDPTANRKSWVGTVIQINDNNLTIEHQNNTRKITISSDTIILNDKKIKTKAESIKVGQNIVAMGYLTNNVLDTKRIVFTASGESENKNQIIIGTIVDISKSSPILVLIPSNNKNNQYQIKTDSKTEGLTKLFKNFDIDNLTTGQKVIVIVSPESATSKTYLASKIINLDSSTSTASATPAASKKQ